MDKIKILPTITTITATAGADWRAKIEEVNELGLKEIFVFPTSLNKKDRIELYHMLDHSKVESIPFVHLKNDMELEEVEYFVKKYSTKVFNIHMQIENPLEHDLSKYKNIIYIENVYHILDEEELKNFAGICLDVSHLENDRLLNPEIYQRNVEIIKKYPIGCNHISALKKDIHNDEKEIVRYDSHYLQDLSELDYLKRYPRHYFSSFIAIELENSIKEQLKIKTYLEKLISNLV